VAVKLMSVNVSEPTNLYRHTHHKRQRAAQGRPATNLRPTTASPVRVDRRVSVRFKRDHTVRLRVRAWHTRGARGHTRNGKPGNGGAIFEHFLYQIRRDVAFDDIPVHQGGVTALQLSRHTVFSPYRTKNIGIYDRYRESIRL